MTEDQREGRDEAYLQSQGIDYCYGTSWREVREQLNKQDFIETPESLTAFKELLESLSEEAKEVVNIVLNTPTELVDALFARKEKGKGGLNRHQLRSYLRYCGWKYRAIETVFGELRKKI